jgi:hypothetical protein
MSYELLGISLRVGTYLRGDGYSFAGSINGTTGPCNPSPALNLIPEGDYPDGSYHSHPGGIPNSAPERLSGQVSDCAARGMILCGDTEFSITSQVPM